MQGLGKQQRISGRCNKCPKPLAMATAGHVHPQGSESNNRWHSVAVSFFDITTEVDEEVGGACLWSPGGCGPHPLPLGYERGAGDFFPLPVAHARTALPPESPCTEKDIHVVVWSFLCSTSSKMAPPFSCGLGPSSVLPQHSTLQPSAHYSLAP